MWKKRDLKKAQMKQRDVKQPMRKTAGKRESDLFGLRIYMWCETSRTEVKPNHQNLAESKQNPGFIIASDAFAVPKANYVKTVFGTKGRI